MDHTYIGAPIRRKEDQRFLTGKGQFVDDVKLPNMLHAAILRSPHPHARILAIDSSAARNMDGVVAIITFQHIEEMLEPRPIPIRMRPYPELKRFLQFPLAKDKVRYVGEPVAVIVAESRYLAEDALDGVAVEYDPLPAVVDVRQSQDGDVLLFEEHVLIWLTSSLRRRATPNGLSGKPTTPARKSFGATAIPPTQWRLEASSLPSSRGGKSSRCGEKQRCPILTVGYWPLCYKCPNTGSTLSSPMWGEASVYAASFTRRTSWSPLLP